MWDPPVLIPNTEVKPHRADGTVRDTVWESRSLPHFTKGSLETEVLLLVYEGQRTRFARKALNDRAERRGTSVRPPCSRAAEGGERHQA